MVVYVGVHLLYLCHLWCAKDACCTHRCATNMYLAQEQTTETRLCAHVLWHTLLPLRTFCGAMILMLQHTLASSWVMSCQLSAAGVAAGTAMGSIKVYILRPTC